ncbi:hypothetical protein PENSPDRAFT_654980 [Peniophora sp. CONT]|nr:hypothetical protein PENSPDRAFT_654980 [Peniophora sp. CONT]
MESYGPGGYYPVTLSQHIRSPTANWRVVHNVGHGAYATERLVQSTNTYVRLGGFADQLGGPSSTWRDGRA